MSTKSKYIPTKAVTVNQFFAELVKIQQVLDRALYRDMVQENQMETELDMNSYRVINGKDPRYDSDLATKRYVDLTVGDNVNLLPGQNVITETKTLASGQLVIPLNIVQASEALFYVRGGNTDNSRLFLNEDYTVTGAAEITLTNSFPAGSTVLCLQSAE